MKKYLKMLPLLLIFYACGKNDTDTIPELVVEEFTEGKIEVEMSMPGNPILGILADFYLNLDPTRNVNEQMEEYQMELSPEEREEYTQFKQTLEAGNSGLSQLAYILTMLNLPIVNSEIYLKDNEVTGRYETFTYMGENRMNDNTSKGQHSLRSRFDSERKITFNYSEINLSEEGSMNTPINTDDFNIQQTGESTTIAGFPCTKSIYTPKGPFSIEDFKLEVWTSPLMPKAVNFQHPYYLEESGGIMKIIIYLLPNEAYPIVYEFSNVNSRAVTSGEMAIQQFEPIYDFNEESFELFIKIFEVTFGALEDDGDD